MTYELIIKGHLSDRMADLFRPLDIELLEGGYTRLTGYVHDQASLYGLLRKIRDFNIELISLKKKHDFNI